VGKVAGGEGSEGGEGMTRGAAEALATLMNVAVSVGQRHDWTEFRAEKTMLGTYTVTGIDPLTHERGTYSCDEFAGGD
jgi:hypothetical protein